MKKGHKVILGAALVTGSATIVGAVLMSQGSDSDGDKNSVDDSNVSCGAIQAGGNVTCNEPKVDESDSFQGEEAAADKGPWRYRIVNTFVDNRDEGLKVRVCNVDDCEGPDSGEQLGLVLQNHAVWVSCKTDSGFNGGEPDGGTTWYKVLWPSDQPSDSIGKSSREDKYSGWMFGKYLSPAGHDGVIAECEDDA